MANEEHPGCMEGCDRTPREPALRPTAGQMLHQLHGMSAAEQVEIMHRMLDASDTAVWCYTRDHEGRLARDDGDRALLLWLHAEAVWQRDLATGALDTMGHTVRSADAEARRWKRLCTQSGVAELEASRRDWAATAVLHDMFFEHWERGTLDNPEPLEPGRSAPCSCLTPDGAAQVAADPKWSLPRCAVHPEADRAGEVDCG